MYVKWFDTVMFYYVILVNLQKCHFFKNFKFPAGFAAARTFRRHGDRNTEVRCRHPPEEMDGDTAGDP
ncbi:unnamed protein product, partial [Staurois parvus]